MFRALTLKRPLVSIPIPSERTVYATFIESWKNRSQSSSKRNPITADREARKSDDLLEEKISHQKKPLEKCVTNITEIKQMENSICFGNLRLF